MRSSNGKSRVIKIVNKERYCAGKGNQQNKYLSSKLYNEYIRQQIT